MNLLAFLILLSLNTKGNTGSKKTYSNSIQNVYFPNAPISIKVLGNECITCHLHKLYPNLKQIVEKQDLKDKVFISTKEAHLIPKDRYPPPHKDTHI